MNLKVKQANTLKSATDNSQNSRKQVSWLSREKKVHAREMLTHISQFVLFSRASDFIHFFARKSLCVLQSYRLYRETT